MESAVTLLPEPLSPTRPRISPWLNERERPSTTRTGARAGAEGQSQICGCRAEPCAGTNACPECRTRLTNSGITLNSKRKSVVLTICHEKSQPPPSRVVTFSATPPPPPVASLLAWDCRGSGNAGGRRGLREGVRVGCIAVGNQGKPLMLQNHQNVVAVCEVDRLRLDAAKKEIEDRTGARVRGVYGLPAVAREQGGGRGDHCDPGSLACFADGACLSGGQGCLCGKAAFPGGGKAG
jgi:hypothetical protein